MSTITVSPELLGVDSQLLPDIELPPGYDPLQHTLQPGQPNCIATIPGQPDVVLRWQELSTERYNTPAAVTDLLQDGAAHMARLEAAGLHVPAHRHVHIEPATLHPQEREGRLMTAIERLRGMQELQSEHGPGHLWASISAVQGLTAYTQGLLEDSHPTFMRDIYKAKQFSVIPAHVSLRPVLEHGGLVLHDSGLALTPVAMQEAGKRVFTPSFAMALGQLSAMAASVVDASRGSSFEMAAVLAEQTVRHGLPSATRA